MPTPGDRHHRESILVLRAPGTVFRQMSFGPEPYCKVRSPMPIRYIRVARRNTLHPSAAADRKPSRHLVRVVHRREKWGLVGKSLLEAAGGIHRRKRHFVVVVDLVVPAPHRTVPGLEPEDIRGEIWIAAKAPHHVLRQIIALFYHRIVDLY